MHRSFTDEIGNQELVAAAALIIVAFLQIAVGLWGALFFLSRLRPLSSIRPANASLILPLTGQAAGLERLLKALDRQTLTPRRLIVSVESQRDPAYRRAESLAQGWSFPIEIVIAEQASHCAQKCANLIAALRRIDAHDEAIVLLDADILPPKWWLSELVAPLLDGKWDLVNGYRWPTVAAPTVGAHVDASIERTIALLPRPRGLNAVWGGSLALSPQALETLEPERILADTLSDDCTIGKQARAHGLRVLTRRVLLVPTPMAGQLLPIWRFGRRQYQILHTYLPALWWLAFGVLSTQLAAWGILLAHLDHAEVRLAISALIIAAVAGCLIQAGVARRLGFPDTASAQLVQCLLALFKPVVHLFHWTMVMAAIATRDVRWGHVSYRVLGPNNVTVRRRDPWKS